MTLLLWCTICTPEPKPDNAIPFGSYQERGKWAAEHADGTGHRDHWLLITLPEEGTDR